MTKDAPAFDFYPERWLSGVAMFTNAEQLSFLRLLCHQWIMQSLPDDLAALKRLGGKGVTPALLGKFPVGADGQRRNGRLETIRTEQRERIASKRLGGALTNAQRHGLGSLSEDDRALVLASPKGRRLFASEVASDNEKGSLAPRHHPPPTTHHIKQERENAGAQDTWPEVTEVITYAETVMASKECAEFFWNQQQQMGWEFKGQPIQDWKPGFRNFVTHWKAKESQKRSQFSSPRSTTAAPAADHKATSRHIAERLEREKQGAEQSRQAASETPEHARL